MKSIELAPATLHVVFSWLRKVFGDALSARLIATSPCVGVELPRKAKREVRPLSLDQVDALTAAMPGSLAYAVTVAAWSGLRSGEVLGLRRHRLDLLGQRGADGVRRAPSIRVAEQLQMLGGPPRLVPPKTEKSARRVPIPTALVDALAAHRAARARHEIESHHHCSQIAEELFSPRSPVTLTVSKRSLTLLAAPHKSIRAAKV